MRVLVLALVLSSPAHAQDGAPAFDSRPLTACLATDASAESCIGLAASACMEGPGGATTVGMGACLDHERVFWDDRLNATYARLADRAGAADDAAVGSGMSVAPQLPALRQMQRSWINFRDAACTYEASRWGGGTGAGPAAIQCALTLTARQAIWLDGYLVEGR